MTQIMIDRALVEQVLETIEGLTRDRLFTAEWAGKHGATQVPEPETCTWHQDGDSDSGTYSTSCRHHFNLEDGTPEDNKMSWCCYCGKKLAQELITEGGDD
jgi:hypothetical protein